MSEHNRFSSERRRLGLRGLAAVGLTMLTGCGVTQVVGHQTINTCADAVTSFDGKGSLDVVTSVDDLKAQVATDVTTLLQRTKKAGGRIEFTTKQDGDISSLDTVNGQQLDVRFRNHGNFANEADGLNFVFDGDGQPKVIPAGVVACNSDGKFFQTVAATELHSLVAQTSSIG